MQPSISSQESNNSVLVSWTKPPGKVENYTVFLKNIFTTEVTEEVLDFSNTSFLFANLSAGMLYRAKVTTFCGPFNASSGFVTNATCKYETCVTFSAVTYYITHIYQKTTNCIYLTMWFNFKLSGIIQGNGMESLDIFLNVKYCFAKQIHK